MPLYMDVHDVPGITLRDATSAHHQDLLIEKEHGCKCISFWVDEKKGNAFCLIEAPGKNDVELLHSKSHGLMPYKIIEVNDSLVESFLGKIYDPCNAAITNDTPETSVGSSFRTLLVSDITDPILLLYQLGMEKANELLNNYKNLIRKELNTHGGSEVEYEGFGFIGSFSSASKAVSCALAIQQKFSGIEYGVMTNRLSLNAGFPVEQSEKIFGDTIQFAKDLCMTAKDNQVVISSNVKDIVTKDYPQNKMNGDMVTLSPADEKLLNILLNKLTANWQDPDFMVSGFSQLMSMSNSQLYRKTVSLFGLSPNQVLKEFRLKKAKELIKKHRYNIAEATFDSGFTSPSYFTKCFKKKYGLTPVAYLHLLQ